MLDLIFGNVCNTKIETACDILVPLDNHHPALSITFKCDTEVPLEHEDEILNFKNCDFNVMNGWLLSVDWDNILNCGIDLAVDRFYDVINECFANFVPKSKIKHNFKFPRWFSPELKELTIHKKEAHLKYKKNKSIANYNKFCELRTHCKNLSKILYSNYIMEIEQNIINNPKFFWKYIREKNNTNTIPQLMTFHDREVSTCIEILDAFANHFSSVYEVSTNTQSGNDGSDLYGREFVNLGLNSYYIKISEIWESLSDIDLNIGAGPDGIPAQFLKNCAFSLSRPIWLIFNNSLNSGIFPNTWKSTFVTPIFKGSGLNTNIENYRPISGISLLPKVFEALVKNFLDYKFKGVIIPNQHGFIKGKSITTNLIVYAEYIFNSLENGESVDAIYTDFSKAFDKLDHSILIKKLSMYGVNGSLLEWINSYLKERQQIVKINNNYSRRIPVLSGVVQGGILSPLLFNIFINDVKDCFLYANFISYADDLKIFLKIESNDDLIHLQEDLNRFFKWCTDNNMTLNVQKCKYIQFSKSTNPIPNNYHLNNIVLDNVNVIRDLGVLFDRRLTFSHHIEYCRNKALKVLGFIKRNSKDFSNINTIKLMYTSLVRPHLEFCTNLWSPYYKTYIDKLDSVQRKFLRYIAFKQHIITDNINYSQMEKDLKINSIAERRDISDILFIFKILNGYIVCPELLSQIQIYVPPRHLRVTKNFELHQHRTLYGKNSPINRIMANGNRCNIDFFNASLISLKHQLKIFNW